MGDTFFDEAKETEWIVTNEVTTAYDTDWEDDSKWSDIDQFTTFSAKKLKKKCMRVFGRKLCLCEFVEFVSHKKHVCHPNKAKKEKKKKMKKIKKKELERRKRLNKQKKKLIKKEK